MPIVHTCNKIRQQKVPGGTKIFMTSEQCFTTSFSSFAIYIFNKWGDSHRAPLKLTHVLSNNTTHSGRYTHAPAFDFQISSHFHDQSPTQKSNSNTVCCCGLMPGAFWRLREQKKNKTKKTKNVTSHSHPLPLLQPSCSSARPRPRPLAKTTMGYTQRTHSLLRVFFPFWL